MRHSIGTIAQLKIELIARGVDYSKFKRKKEYEQALIVVKQSAIDDDKMCSKVQRRSI